MTSTRGEAERRGFGCVGTTLFSLVLVSGMTVLVVVLAGECSAGTDTLDAYAASVRGGAPVTAAIGGDEAEALTAVLRRTESTSISNFQHQAGTACYWVTLHHGDGSTGARFLLADRTEGREVIAASLRRECECPDPDFEQRCHLR